jgi:hypothetical protein
MILEIQIAPLYNSFREIFFEERKEVVLVQKRVWLSPRRLIYKITAGESLLEEDQPRG